jgi:hypothetical protein
MLDLAQATGDADLRIAGHQCACVCYYFAGKFTKAVEHANKVLDLYDAENHRHLADILNIDPKTGAGVIGAISAWMLGYPDRASRIRDETEVHARQRDHPFDLGYALTMGAHEFDHRYDHEDLRRRAEECERLGRENSLLVLWALFAPVSYGLAFFREGKIAEGIAPLKAGIAFWETIGGRLCMPIWNAFLAEGIALTGDIDNALNLIDEQIVQIERPGWEERLYYAEVLRLKGWMLAQGRPCRCRTELCRLARLGAPPAGENVGAAHGGQPCTPVAGPREAPRGVWVARPGLRLVHRGV